MATTRLRSLGCAPWPPARTARDRGAGLRPRVAPAAAAPRLNADPALKSLAGLSRAEAAPEAWRPTPLTLGKPLRLIGEPTPHPALCPPARPCVTAREGRSSEAPSDARCASSKQLHPRATARRPAWPAWTRRASVYAAVAWTGLTPDFRPMRARPWSIARRLKLAHSRQAAPSASWERSSMLVQFSLVQPGDP
jgi:hypothetical protein